MNLRHLAFFLMLLSGAVAQAGEKKFVVDPVHSGVSFKIRHLYAMFPGRFDGFSGTIVCDTSDLTTMKVRATVDLATVSTANVDRDKHLKSGDFFNVEKFPTATFESTEVRPGADHALTVRGTLSLHGITSEIVFEGKILGYGDDMKGKKRVGYQGRGTIDRAKFGVTYNSTLAGGLTMLGNEVELFLDVEAVEADSSPEPTKTPAATSK